MLWKKNNVFFLSMIFFSLVCHGELVRLLFVAACELVLDTSHQVVVVRAPDGLLDHVKPPRGVQLDLHTEDEYI